MLKVGSACNETRANAPECLGLANSVAPLLD